MKQNKLNNQIAEELKRFDGFWKSSNWWGGILILSSIYNCICSARVPTKLRNIWLSKIMNPSFNDEIIKSIRNSFIQKYQRIEKIISIGDRFNDDEFLLVLTYHTELCLIKDYLNERKMESPNLNLKQIEVDTKKLGNMKHNQRDFRRAINQIKDNWGLPITTVWT